MTLLEIIETDPKLSEKFQQIIYLQTLADSIDYVDNTENSQQDIDDHILVNKELCRAIETIGITPAQYYEIINALQKKT